jgi:hypothetical protein
MPSNGRVPLTFPTDRAALDAALQTTGSVEPEAVKALWIKNTLSCETVLASEAYLAEARGRNDLRVESEVAPLSFDGHEDLVAAF